MTDDLTQTETEDKSHRFPLGARVYDRDKDAKTGMVVVGRPDATCEEWDVPGTGRTVADFNEGYEADSPVIVVAFEQGLENKLSDWESIEARDLWDEVKDSSIKEYAYPEPRLIHQTTSLPDHITTYHELICYQQARLIQLAAGVAYEGFMWSKYHQLRDGEIEMASISKEDQYQLREDFGVCIYCKEEAETQFDHVIPISEGGDNSISNQVPACPDCNSSKSDKDVIKWCKERGEPVPRIVWGKYLKQYESALREEGKLEEELPEEERAKWDGVEIQRNISDRIYKRYRDR